MHELIFLVDEAPEGGYTARALGQPIFTEADDSGGLHQAVRDAVQCHLEPGQAPQNLFIREIGKRQVENLFFRLNSRSCHGQ